MNSIFVKAYIFFSFSATISQKDLEELITNKKSTEIFDIDIPSDQILSDPGKILNPGMYILKINC